jgi:hypothetical protein
MLTEYAVIDNGSIVRRKQYDLSGWPDAKKNALDEKGDGGPVYRPVSYVGEGPVEAVSIGMTTVTITRSAAPPVEPAPPQPVDPIIAVNIERDRRITAGVTFGGKLFQTDERSMRRIGDAARQASAAIANGVQANNLRWHGGETDFAFTAADNTSVNMDAPTMEALGNAVNAHELKLIEKARALKDRPGGPPPADQIANDSHWT